MDEKNAEYLFSEKKESESRIVTEEELLLIDGRGKNTWWLYFQGTTEGATPIAFIYRLNITTIPMGLKAVRMYDTLLAITYEEYFDCERDYAMIKNKQHVPSDCLSFETNLSKLEGNFNLLDLYAVISNCEVNVTMNNSEGIVKKSFLKTDDFVASKGNTFVDMFAVDMACQGMICVDGMNYSVKGIAWVEKAYVEIPKHMKKNKGIDSVKICIFPDVPSDARIVIYGIFDQERNKEFFEALVIQQDGSSKNYPVKGLFEKNLQRMESPATNKFYPLPAMICIPELELKIEVTPSIREQEMVAEDGIYSEYIGSGQYNGSCQGRTISGRCSIEMIGSFSQ